MGRLLLCVSGEYTEILSVESSFTSVRQLTIASNASRVVDWNQNNNYIFICSSNGNMYLQNIAKDTLISSVNRVNEEHPVPISSGCILSGSKFAITGDVYGNIRLWPISKAGFSKPVMDVCFANTEITSFVEYSNVLSYAGTDSGQIIEINTKIYSAVVICGVENDSIQDMVISNGTVFFSTASGQVYRLLPLIKRFSCIFTSDMSSPLHLSFTLSALMNCFLCYSENRVGMLNQKTYQLCGFVNTNSKVISADIINESIVIATEDGAITLWNAYDLSSPVASFQTNSRISTLRFFHLLSLPSVNTSTETTPQIIQNQTRSQPLPTEPPAISPQRLEGSAIITSPSATPLSSESSSPSISRFSRSSPIVTTPSISVDSILNPTVFSTSSPLHCRENTDTVISHTKSISHETVMDVAPIEGNKIIYQTVRDVIEPQMMELKTLIHRELSELKGDVVRQFMEQEIVIQKQQERIEQLLQQMNQRR